MKSAFIPMATKAIVPVVVAGVAVTLSSSASGNMNINLALPGTVSTATPNGVNTYSMTPASANSPLEIDIWAQITPTNTLNPDYPGTVSNYSFSTAYYGLFSQNVVGGPTGSGITSAATEAWSSQVGAQSGVLGDQNADSQGDLGAPYPPVGVNTNLAAPKGITLGGTYAYQVSPAADLVALPGGGYEFLIEKAFFTPNAADVANNRQIDYNVATATSGTGSAVWYEDGAVGENNRLKNFGSSSFSTVSGNYSGHGTMEFFIVVPEPASLSLLGLTAAGLLARRRKA